MIGDYRLSRAEARRDCWMESQRLDDAAPDVARELVGRAVRYDRHILVADRMIGIVAKDDVANRRVRGFVRGVLYLADQWKSFSPYSQSGSVAVEIMTVGGQRSLSTKVRQRVSEFSVAPPPSSLVRRPRSRPRLEAAGAKVVDSRCVGQVAPIPLRGCTGL